MATHTNEKPHKCHLCGARFKQVGNMKRHLIVAHSSESKTRSPQCTICLARFACHEYLKNHLQLHNSGPPHSCLECDGFFESDSELKTHMGVHTADTPFKCHLCPSRFKRHATLLMHTKSHTGEKLYKSFATSPRSFQRLPVKLKDAEEENEEVILMPDEDEGMRMGGDGFFKEGPDVLGETADDNTPEEEHKCTLCKATFTEVINLHAHIAADHSMKRTQQCPHCPMSFREKNSLKNHLLTHTGEKPHACDICGSRFSLASNMKRHMLIHTGKKPFECPACPRKFRQKGDLNSHVKSKHPWIDVKELSSTGNQPNAAKDMFQCRICSEAFDDRELYRKHLLVSHVSRGKALLSIPPKFSDENNAGIVKKTDDDFMPDGAETIEITGESDENDDDDEEETREIKREVHDRNSGIFTCLKCEVKFSDERAIEEHLLTHNDDDDDQYDQDIEIQLQ